MASARSITLSNGAEMPLLGFGSHMVNQEASLKKAVHVALDAGYRLFDTATQYGNEEQVGDALQEYIAQQKIKREDLFLVTKLPMVGMRAEAVEKYLRASLKRLRTHYVDLYLIHKPYGFQEHGEELYPRAPDGTFLLDLDTDHLAIWKAMEAQVDSGRARAIGLSDFNETQIKRILEHCRIKPANVQAELHIYYQQKSLVDLCKKNGIVLTAFSPLGSPGKERFFKKMGNERPLQNLLVNPVVKEIAEKHRKNPAQILLKNNAQRGIGAIPNSSNPTRIRENISIFDFELDEQDMEKLNNQDQGADGQMYNITDMFKGLEKHPESPYH